MSIFDTYPDLDSKALSSYDFQGCWTAADRSRPYLELDVLAAILVTRGNYSRMATLLNRTRARVREYVMGHTELTEVLNDVIETRIDEMEEMGLSLATAGDGPMIRYLLQNLGKSRGYGTIAQDDGPKEATPLSITFEVKPAVGNVRVTHPE